PPVWHSALFLPFATTPSLTLFPYTTLFRSRPQRARRLSDEPAAHDRSVRKLRLLSAAGGIGCLRDFIARCTTGAGCASGAAQTPVSRTRDGAAHARAR